MTFEPTGPLISRATIVNNLHVLCGETEMTKLGWSRRLRSRNLLMTFCFLFLKHFLGTNQTLLSRRMKSHLLMWKSDTERAYNFEGACLKCGRCKYSFRRRLLLAKLCQHGITAEQKRAASRLQTSLKLYLKNVSQSTFTREDNITALNEYNLKRK